MIIYLIDDNQINLDILEDYLKLIQPNFEVVKFINPILAITSFYQKSPDLIIVDYMMDEMNGIDFIRRIKTFPGGDGIPSIMITAIVDNDVKAEALEAGINDFLSRPISLIELKARVNNLISLRNFNLQMINYNMTLTRDVKKATEEILKREEELIYRLSKAAEFRDNETGEHILRMSHYSRIIAKKINLSAIEVELIYKAAPMHDIGKIGISDEILLKPGKYTEEEFEIMKSHPKIGYSILEGSSSELIQKGAEIALYHHEKWDGSGYPNQLSGEDIPISGRIVAIADVFDALGSNRPYKKPWALSDIRGYLLEMKGKHFDPDLLDAFFDSWDEILLIKDKYSVSEAR
ncbi:MAG: HD domain-containing protein [Leptospiraceae bacterium]|nr:HD domain-containing protein [Leptospiraceae bacterium]